MRFQPRIVRPDESDEALDLPADLAELAEQLTADAQWLAERYPAQDAAQPVPAGVDRGRRLARSAAVALVLVGVGLWTGKLWHGAVRPPRPPFNAALAADDATSRRSTLDAIPALGAAAASSGAPLLGGLSGGEQEGVLDLLEEQSLDEARISI